MRFNTIRLAVVIAACAVLAWSWKADFQAAEPAEKGASLFDNEAFAYKSFKVDANASSVDVRATVHKWTHAGGEAALGVMEDLAGLVSLTSTAYAAAPPTSAASETAGPVNCSTANTTDIKACSTNNNTAGGQGFNAGCSTSAGGTGSGTATCSAFVPAPPPDNNNNNVTCSAGLGVGATPPAVTNCSAGGTTGAVGCSTAGGQSQPGNSNGAVGCSAMANNTSGNTCSTTGGAATVTCSTYGGNGDNGSGGQHQSCSAGNAGASNDVPPVSYTATCSATGTPAAGKTANCSVNAAGSNAKGVYGNQCTAIAFGNSTTDGKANCSTSGKGTTATCSVAASNTGGTNNTQCTAFPTRGGTYPTGYSCSASGGATGGCSVIDAKGSVTPPVGTPPKSICGGPVTGEGGTGPQP